MPGRSPTRDLLPALAAGLAVAAFAAPAVQADAASGRTPPAPATPVLSATATGVPNYACEYDAEHRLTCAIQRPEAMLFDGGGTLDDAALTGMFRAYLAHLAHN